MNLLDAKRPARSTILTINGGSSSLKFALFEPGEAPRRLLVGKVERVGREGARLALKDGDGVVVEEGAVDAPDQGAAAGIVIERVGMGSVGVVGHRVVFGGERLYRPERVTAGVLEGLRGASADDPDHLPGEIALIEAFAAADGEVPQVVCFDTEFHHEMPRLARIVPIPRRFEAKGVRRYGFHGLSYEYLMGKLREIGEDGGRVVLAHLGSGASLAAVRGGRCLDTTMGFTPASGLMMGTRTGDIDPGLVRHLCRVEGLSVEAFDAMVNHESGLLGVSETSADVRDLVARRGFDVRAAEAIDLFCYRARSWVGAFAAVLGGLDTLVFAGGIGENAPEVRRGICEGLEFLGVRLDAGRNASGDGLISADGAGVKVRVIPTDEEIVIARKAAAFL